MKQKSQKFNDLDRNRVIAAIEEHCGVTLKKVGRRSKWLRDESGRSWWVLGGEGSWHGIPEEMMEDEKRAQLEGVLVIADKKRSNLEVFAGPLTRLVKARDRFSRAAQTTGDYQFTVKVTGNLMQCQEALDVELKRIASVPYCDEDRAKDRRVKEASRMVALLSQEERETVLAQLQSEKGRVSDDE